MMICECYTAISHFGSWRISNASWPFLFASLFLHGILLGCISHWVALRDTRTHSQRSGCCQNPWWTPPTSYSKLASGSARGYLEPAPLRLRSARFWRHGWGIGVAVAWDFEKFLYFSIFLFFFLFYGSTVWLQNMSLKCTSIHFFWGRCNYGATRVVFSSYFYDGPKRNTGDFKLLYERYWRGGQRLLSTWVQATKTVLFHRCKG